jgi:hypothetical protein
MAYPSLFSPASFRAILGVSGRVFDAEKGGSGYIFFNGFLDYFLLFYDKLRGIIARFQKAEPENTSN